MPPEDKPAEVLTSLPRSRPQRPNARRDAARAKSAKAAEKAAPAEKAAAPTHEAKPASAAKAKPSPAAKAKAAAPKRAAAPKAKPGSKAKPGAATAPKAGSSARKRVPPAGYEVAGGEPGTGFGGADLVGTAVQAAGELAQIGIAVGNQALKSALGRLGRR